MKQLPMWLWLMTWKFYIPTTVWNYMKTSNSTSGLKTMKLRFRWAAVVLPVFMITSLPLQADELITRAQQEHAETEPDIGLLEFLGEWETTSGEWIDPNQLEEIMASSKAEEQEDESL